MLQEMDPEETPRLWLPLLVLLLASSGGKGQQTYAADLLDCIITNCTEIGISTGENTELPTFSATGGLHSVLEDTVSPAFSATVIIIVTVIVSGSAYLCFLKYICSGCCKSTQVVPARRLDPSRSEEQV